jgi:hypothetical protein
MNWEMVVLEFWKIVLRLCLCRDAGRTPPRRTITSTAINRYRIGTIDWSFMVVGVFHFHVLWRGVYRVQFWILVIDVLITLFSAPEGTTTLLPSFTACRVP